MDGMNWLLDLLRTTSRCRDRTSIVDCVGVAQVVEDLSAQTNA